MFGKPDFNDPFTRIKYYAVEIVSLVVFIAVLIGYLWKHFFG